MDVMLRGGGLEDTILEFDENIDNDDIYVQSMCIQVIGFMAMRFDYFHEEGFKQIKCKYKDSEDFRVLGAISDAQDYIDHLFLRSNKKIPQIKE